MREIYDISRIFCTPSELQSIVVRGEVEFIGSNKWVVFTSGKIRGAIDYSLFNALRKENADPNLEIQRRYRKGNSDFVNLKQLEKLAELKAHTNMSSNIPYCTLELKGASKQNGITPAILLPQYNIDTHKPLLIMDPRAQIQHIEGAYREANIFANKGVAYSRLFTESDDKSIKPFCGIKCAKNKTVFDYLFGKGVNFNASDEEIQNMLDSFGRLFNYLCKRRKLRDGNHQFIQLFNEGDHMDEATFNSMFEEYKQLRRK